LKAENQLMFKQYSAPAQRVLTTVQLFIKRRQTLL